MQSFANNVNDFNSKLNIETSLPDDVEVLNPFQNATGKRLSSTFYEQFYNDERKRVFIFGINPGRHGAGLTGIPFTDPVHLTSFCGIPNDLPKKHELSSLFIYRLIEAYGGVKQFYNAVYFTAVSPLGYIKDGLNFNYYDSPVFAKKLIPDIKKWIELQLPFGASKTAICMGQGKNYQFLQKINKEMGYFDKIIPVPHARYIMQYKRKQLAHYVEVYIQSINDALINT